MPRTIKKHIIPIADSLFKLEEHRRSNYFWTDLDRSLRIYFSLDNPTDVEEEALNNLLLEIGRKIDRFKCEDGNYEEVFQRLSIIRSAFRNHKLKTQRPEVSQEIKILSYILETEGRLSEKDQKRLDYLYKLRKKI